MGERQSLREGGATRPPAQQTTKGVAALVACALFALLAIGVVVATHLILLLSDSVLLFVPLTLVVGIAATAIRKNFPGHTDTWRVVSLAFHALLSLVVILMLGWANVWDPSPWLFLYGLASPVLIAVGMFSTRLTIYTTIVLVSLECFVGIILLAQQR